MAQRAVINGVGLTTATSPSKQAHSTIELSQQAVWAALDHAGVRPDDLDALVIGNIDGFEGTALAAKHTTRLLGIGANLPVTILNTGGTTGGNLVQVAARQIRAGENRVLCLGGSTFFGATDIQSAINTNSPMIVEQPLGMGAFHMGAFAASAYLDRFNLTPTDLARVIVADHAKAMTNPYAHLRYPVDVDDVLSGTPLSSPLTLPMVCPVSTSATAVVVVAESIAAQGSHAGALIRAIGTSSDPYLGGGKGDFSIMENLATLARRVYTLADIREPHSDIDVVEVFAPYAHMQPMQLEALSICAPGTATSFIAAGETSRTGSMPTNLSGGPKCTNAGVAGELNPYAYVALQLMGDAPDDMQVAGACTGLAHGTGGTFFQFENLAIMTRYMPGERSR